MTHDELKQEIKKMNQNMKKVHEAVKKDGPILGCDPYTPDFVKMLDNGDKPKDRQWLIQELNKIDGVKASQDGDVLDIYFDNNLRLMYEYGELICFGQIILAANRTCEQVLNIVKNLVG